MSRRLFLAIPLLIMATVATSAHACSIPPPAVPPEQQPGESVVEFEARLAAFHFSQLRGKELRAARLAAYQEGYERALWDSAPVAVLAQIIEKGESSAEESPFGAMPEVTLRVVETAKGFVSLRPFKLTYEGVTSCGPVGLVSVVDGEVGEQFVLFASGRDLGMESVIAGYSQSEARNGRTKFLFEK